MKMPVPSWNANWNGVRHFAHVGLIDASVVKKDWHDVELKPSAHPAFASARSVEAHAPLFTESTGVLTVDGQLV